jgi:hypothetical protein
MVGAFWFLPISQNRPHTHPCHPWPQRPEFDASHRASVSARVAAATACCRNTTRVERVSEGRHSSGGGGGDLRRFGFSVFASTGGCTKVTGRRSRPGKSLAVPPKCMAARGTTRRSLPSARSFLSSASACCPAIGKSLDFAASKNSPSPALAPPASPGLMRVAASAGRSVADAQSNPAPA